MFGIGGGEMIVILLVALIVLGPDKLPQAAKTAGKVMSDLRKLSSGFQNELRTAMDDTDASSTTTARRNVLRKDDPDAAAGVPAAGAEADTGPDPVSDAIAAVSGNGAATSPAAGTPAASKARAAKKAAATKAAPSKAAPSKAGTARKAAARKAAPSKTGTARKAAARTTPASKAAPSKAGADGAQLNGSARPARPRRRTPLTAADAPDPRAS